MGNLKFRQVHLDFHTSEKIQGVGEKFDAEKFIEQLKSANVNSINCFARCHHGMIYYDTKFPAKHPHLKRNLLKEQIDACHSAGINAPIYISAGLDEYMAREHPEWIGKRADGNIFGRSPLQAGWKKMCFNSPYVDYLKEQTAEVMELFSDDVDGIWFDIIHQDPCCCTYCMRDMEKLGFNAEIEDERKKFAKQVVSRFKNEMTQTVKNYKADCPVIFNSGHIGPEIRPYLDLYGHLELESLPSGGWGYEHFPITVRYAKNLNKEYLGMTGKFHKSWADFGGFKNQPALEYECFMALSNGAKCSIGDQLHPTGEMNKTTYKLIGSVYKQVEEVEQWCDDVTAVSEIAIFTPEAIGNQDGRVDSSVSGAYRMLIEEDYQFDIIDDKSELLKYSVIILPDKITLNAELSRKIEDYITKGGKLLFSFDSGLNYERTKFELSIFKSQFLKDGEYYTDYVMMDNDFLNGIEQTEYVMYDGGRWVLPSEKAKSLAKIHQPYFNRAYNHFCSHFQTPNEKESEYPAIIQENQMIYYAHPIFSMYHKHGNQVYKKMVLNGLVRLLPDKLVKTNAPTTAQLNLNYQAKENRYILHILHYIPERRYEVVDTIEDVIPLYFVDIEVKFDEKPRQVYQAPSMEKIDFSFDGKYVKLTLEKITGHYILVFEF